MSENFDKQKTIGDDLWKILTNIKKDSSDRKTVNYCEERLLKLENLWTIFCEQDALIRARDDISLNHSYFKNEFYQSVETRYRETKKHIEQLMLELNKQKPANSNTNGKMTQLERLRTKAENSLERTIKSIQDESTSNQSKAYYQYQIKMLQKYWESLTKVQEELVMVSEQEIDIDERFEQEYAHVMIDLQHKINMLETASPPNNINSELRLPRVTIPKFEGNYNTWTSFYDLFQRLVDENTSLSGAEKLHHLKSNITGEAEKLIRHMQVTNENYPAAWELLKNRYNNPRLLVTTQLQTLFGIQKQHNESSKGVKYVYDKTRESLFSLDNLGINTQTWGPLVIHMTLQKLDSESQKLYELSLQSSKELQSLEEFFTFLESRFQSLEVLERATNTDRKISGKDCMFCKADHSIYYCKKFLAIEVSKRSETLMKENRCLKCFDHHQTTGCLSKMKCKKCHRNHHTLLHINKYQKEGVETATNQVKVTESNIQTYAAAMEDKTVVLLPTALIKVMGVNGQEHFLRALIDQGSQASFITENAAQLLLVPKVKVDTKIAGMGNAINVSKYMLNITIKPRFSSKFEEQVRTYVMPKLTKIMPSKSIHLKMKCPILEKLVLADPYYDTPGPIDVILGAEIHAKIILGEVVKNGAKLPIAQKTELGWIISGEAESSSHGTNQIISMVTNVELEEQLTRFWEVEEISQTKPFKQEEQQCEEIYQKTVKRNPNGRYIVRLPFVENGPDLGSSRKMAIATLLHMEKRFMKYPDLKKQYVTFMKEYEVLGHMSLVKETQESSKNNYLPHHAVFKEASTTTKLRVVFDAARKTSNGKSLNNNLMVGPKIQDDLLCILLRWRKYKIVMTADIEKMYRQILVHPQDSEYQRIVWREDPNKPIKDYKLTTVTYGTACAPHLAIRTLQQISIDEEHKFPVAAEIIRRDFYVDDVLTGADSISEAQKIKNELLTVLSAGGLRLRKWTSNTQELLEDIDPRDREMNLPVDIDADESIKTLGLQWNPIKDRFSFSTCIDLNPKTPTKRQLLSQIARLFDPLGWLAPIITKTKIMMQRIWLENIGWEEEIPADIAKEWLDYKNELHHLDEMYIPRWFGYESNDHIEIHGFSDASEKAYAAVLYTRILHSSGGVTVRLLAAKSKIAPQKEHKITIPRLELMGAVLLATLQEKVTTAMKIQNKKIFLWTDSTAVLGWINGHPTNWNVFVANRVAAIQAVSDPRQWGYVSTSENPADCASRGLSPSKLKGNLLWWNGPVWMFKKEITKSNLHYTTQLEKRKITTITTLSAAIEKEDRCLLERFSSLNKLKRVTAYMLRFTKKLRQPQLKFKKYLEHEELMDAEQTLIKMEQRIYFSEEIRSLETKNKIKKDSKLQTLNPFLDDNKIIRVGGRLENAALDYNQKHPIILPSTGTLTRLIINNIHETTKHGNNSLTLATIRHRFWIINGGKAVRASINKCVKCYRYNAQAGEQKMGNLPTARVTPAKVFAHSGVDYAGPFTIRMSKGRGCKTHKAYVALFVCMTTKAIHLELVSDLSAEAFIAAFNRFVARRGQITDLYSDNGTNFVLANKLLNCKVQEEEAENRKVIDMIASNKIKWHFNPPAAPHFGGLWEAGVKSMKYHLRRVIGEINLTFEEFSTLLAQIEACLNSRPLCPLSNNSDDLEILTPGHFLIGRALLAVPDESYINIQENKLTRWQLLQKMTQHFWQKWQDEYLVRLQQRPKWASASDNLKIGQIVIIKDENQAPCKWPLARIIETHPGDDGLTRVVSLQTDKSILKRPITKICPLPIEEVNDEMNTLLNQVIPETTSNPVKNQRLFTNKDSSNRTKTSGTDNEKTQYRKRINPVSMAQYRQAEDGEATRTSSTAAAKRKMCWQTLATLFMFFTMAFGSKAEPFTVSQFTNKPGVYFDSIGDVSLIHSDWNLIIYFDLTKYWREVNQFKKSINDVEILCKTNKTDVTYCKNVLSQLDHSITDIDHINELLHQRNGFRKKRAAFNFIGTIANKLFGVLDQDDAAYYEEHIKQSSINEHHLISLLKNQTSIQEATSNVFKKSVELIDRQFNNFKAHIKEIEECSNKVVDNFNRQEIQQKINIVIIQLMLAMDRYRQTQNVLLDIIMETHQGKIHPLLLTPEQLKKQFALIREQLPSTSLLKLPGDFSDKGILGIYQTLTARVRIITNQIIFNVQIPLISSTTYQLFAIIPVPTAVGHEFVYIQPSIEVIAASLDRTEYYATTLNNLQQCNRIKNTYLCHHTAPLRMIGSTIGKCEINLLTKNNHVPGECEIRATKPMATWIKLHAANTWIYVLDHEYLLNSVCDNHPSSHSLAGEGILQLGTRCVIKTGSIILTSENQITSSFTTSYTPSFNMSGYVEHYTKMHRLNYSSTSTILQAELGDDIKRIDAAIQKQQQSAVLQETHNFHHYAATYGTLTLVISLCMAGGIYVMVKWHGYRRKPTPAPRRNHDDFIVPDDTSTVGGEDVQP